MEMNNRKREKKEQRKYKRRPLIEYIYCNELSICIIKIELFRHREEGIPVWFESLAAVNHKLQNKDAFPHFQFSSTVVEKIQMHLDKLVY